MKAYKYPKSFWLIAEQIGYARTVVNQKILDNNPRFDRGKKNTHVDTVGILGELIAIDYLTNKKIDFEMAKLLFNMSSMAETNPFSFKALGIIW